METPAGTTYQFGPFEVNAASGELLKQGKRVRLQEQPFRLLVILLENAGKVVSRAEIQSHIWEENTFVDFDSSLRVAVGKLRDALGDDAENPRYIETIPKRGYRFLGPAVRFAHSTADANEDRGASMGTGPPPSTAGRMWALAAAILLVTLAAGVWIYFLHHRSFRGARVLAEKDMVVLADFANSTGDPVFEGTLRQGMAAQLEQSPFLGIVSEERMQRVLRLMGQPVDARLTPEIAYEICERTGSAAVLNGSIASLGSQYVLGLAVRDCRTGDILAEEQAQAARKEDVLNALTQIASTLRTQLGESLTTVERHNTPVDEATTPSLEALKAYSMGWKVVPSSESAGVPFFKRAIEIDPKFAAAHASLGLVYGIIGESALSAESTSRAYALRDRASDRERFFITASYDGRVTGNFEKARLTCQAWSETYPLEVNPHAYLAGFIYPASAKYEESIEEAKKAIALNPDFSVGYLMLASGYLAMGRFAEAEDTIQRVTDRQLENDYASAMRYDIAFLKGDESGMKRDVALAEAKPGTEAMMSDHEAFAAAYSGHLRQTRALSQHAVELDLQAGQREEAALFEIGEALREGLFGNAPAAIHSANAALQLTKGREVQYGAALALALAGDSARSLALANDLERRFPEDTSVRFSYLPTLRGHLALNRHEPAKAIQLLQIAAADELGTQRTTIHGLFGAMYPVYVRGEAYLATHQGPEAAAEFQKILDHRGIVISDPIGALAHLQLGRAFVLSGDKTKAKAAYQDFLNLWKDADPEIPILKHAKSEYAKMQ